MPKRRAHRDPKPAKSAAKARAKHGGARAGAGRKREKLPSDALELIGSPPTTGGARALREWNCRLIAVVAYLSIQGRITTELAASIRANAGALDRALPAEKPGAGLAGEADDDEDEDEDDGPELTTVSGGFLRVG